MPDLFEGKLQVRGIVGAHEFAAYYDLRWRVLREPWMQTRDSERDARDADAVHLGCWMGERLLGVGRLHFNSPTEAQTRFMAVAPEWVGQGIGSLLLRELERRAVAGGAVEMVLDARESALGFYEKQGYRPLAAAGLLFNQIAHWKMSKRL